MGLNLKFTTDNNFIWNYFNIEHFHVFYKDINDLLYSWLSLRHDNMNVKNFLTHFFTNNLADDNRTSLNAQRTVIHVWREYLPYIFPPLSVSVYIYARTRIHVQKKALITKIKQALTDLLHSSLDNRYDITI